ncbi:MAG: hypothetical protein GY757_36595, partial [bacterium]|nr:hypothetical protein [bacterium]
ITRAHRELLPVFAKHTTPDNADETFKTALKDYAEEKFKTTLERIEAIKEEVSGLSIQFIERYKAVPGAEDKEAANIEKEGVRRKIFLLVKEYRSLLTAVSRLRESTNNYPQQQHVLAGLLEKWLLHAKKNMLKVVEDIYARLDEIKGELPQFDESILPGLFVRYSFYAEEETILFRGRFKYERLFDNPYILAILGHFYNSIAQLFLKQNDIDTYITFVDREITLFPEKTGIFK